MPASHKVSLWFLSSPTPFSTLLSRLTRSPTRMIHYSYVFDKILDWLVATYSPLSTHGLHVSDGITILFWLTSFTHYICVPVCSSMVSISEYNEAQERWKWRRQVMHDDTIKILSELRLQHNDRCYRISNSFVPFDNLINIGACTYLYLSCRLSLQV